MRLHRLSTIAFWPCRVLLIVFLVCVKVFGLEHHSNETRPNYSAMEINRTEDYQVGYAGSDPFADQLGGTTSLSHRGKRKKRSAVHLYNMVSCATGCDPLLYKGYGCYCGFLGSGYTVDGIDRCCQMHDWCYDSSGCPMFLEYFVPYLWKCYHRQPLCGIDLDSPGSCGQRLCHCDQLLAQCLRKYPCPTTKALCTSSPWRLLQNVLML